MLQAMDREGIDVSIVFRTLASHLIAVAGSIPSSRPRSAARSTAGCDFCDKDRARLKAAALIPLQDARLAAEEARRAVRDLGAVALVICPTTRQRPALVRRRLGSALGRGRAAGCADHVPRDPDGLPGAPRPALHGQLRAGPRRRPSGGDDAGPGSLLTGGVFARFPGLRAAFLEASCSWVPWWLWVLDERVEKFGDDERFALTMPPSEYFRRHCAVGRARRGAATATLATLGDDNIVISSDWPHDDSAYPHAIDEFLALPGVGADEQAQDPLGQLRAGLRAGRKGDRPDPGEGERRAALYRGAGGRRSAR